MQFMKKTMLILVSVLMISFMGCSKDADIKQNWTFTLTSVVTMNPAMEGYPQTTITTIEQDNLTANEADAALKSMNTTSSVTGGGYTMTSTITATKEVKK